MEFMWSRTFLYFPTGKVTKGRQAKDSFAIVFANVFRMVLKGMRMWHSRTGAGTLQLLEEQYTSYFLTIPMPPPPPGPAEAPPFEEEGAFYLVSCTVAMDGTVCILAKGPLGYRC